MAKVLHKDPYTYQREHGSFLRELKQFHELRGTTFKRIPRINGKEIDLYLLYVLVTTQGGWEKVNDRNEWEKLCPNFNIPESCMNGGVALKQIYIRYLDYYEKIHFHGEDPALTRNEDIESRHKRKILATYHNVSFTYNTHQHNVPESSRTSLGLSAVLHQPCDYEKLMLSLMSPLPNEQDFSLNVCTLLSNEGRHTLRLDRCPRIVDFLLGYTENIEQLYNSCGSTLQFWEEVISDPLVKHLLSNDEIEQIDKNLNNTSEFEEVLFATKRQQGCREKEGNRIQQIALIIRNLSFDDPSREVLACNNACLRFLLLCCYCSYGALPQLAMETLSNLCADIELKDPSTHLPSSLLLSLVEEAVCSKDRARVMVALECLNKLAQREQHEDLLTTQLRVSTYQNICLYLALPDILLLVHTLECLYALSALGEVACNAISNSHGGLQSLFSLLTVEGQSFGPKACVLMKVVESGRDSIEKDTSTATSIPPESLKSYYKAVEVKQTASNCNFILPTQIPSSLDERETFVHSWLKSYLELKTDSSIEQGELYKDYLTYISQQSRKSALNAQEFVCFVRVVFGINVGPVKKVLPSGIIEYHYQGLSRHSTSHVMTPLSNLTSEPTLRLSPILKAQLSSSTNQVKKELPQQYQVSSSPVPLGGPKNLEPKVSQELLEFKNSSRDMHYELEQNLSDEGSLIRNLLASKVNQRQKQKQEISIDSSSPPCKKSKLEESNSEVNGILDEQNYSHQKDPTKVRGILAEMLERKVCKEPQNGVIDKEIRISDRGLEIVVNHLKGNETKLHNGDQHPNGDLNNTDHTAPTNLLESLVKEVGIPDIVEVAESNPVVTPPVTSASLGQLILPGQNNPVLVSSTQGQRQLVFFQTAPPNTSRPMVYVQSPQSFLVTSAPSSPMVLTNTFAPATSVTPSVSSPNIKTVILMTSQGQKVMLPAQTFPASSLHLQTQILTSTIPTSVASIASNSNSSAITRQAKSKVIKKKSQIDKVIVPNSSPVSVDCIPSGKNDCASHTLSDKIICEWNGCGNIFTTFQKLYIHACHMHCSAEKEEQYCLWNGCDQIQRRRFSLMTHLLDKHCSEQALQASRRKKSIPTRIESAEPIAHNCHPGYAPNAALQAIRRHALETFTTRNIPEENEGPVTKSIRLTAALTLRNLGIYSFHARSYLRAHESQLAQLAMSNQESARTIAQVLCDLTQGPTSS